MLITFGAFMFNLLCGLVPCDPRFDKPQISSRPFPEIAFRDGRAQNKSLIPARVTLPSGNLEGYHLKASRGRTIFGFEGIPYGRAARWKSPTPREPWKGTLHAKKPGPHCLQLSVAKFLRVYGSEDCLYLNVFTPELPYKEVRPELPVAVYFHGGAFIMGSGSEHGPSYLLNEDVLLVTVNYRLGILGFLSTGDNAISGNWGLKDQALAIEWVHQNIAEFGGNPNKITLWGYSSGGVSVHLHMISKRTRHLFTQGLSLGAGSAFHHFSIQKPWRARSYANRIGKQFRCPTDDSQALAQCLLKVPSNSLVAQQLTLFDWFPFPAVVFSPTIEPIHPEAFLTESAEEAYEKGHVADKPWICTTNSDEGLSAILVLQLLMRWLPMRLAWNYAAPYYLDYGYIANNSDEITEKVTKFYLGNKPPIRGTPFEFADMMTDRFFRFGVRKALQAHSQIAPTYSYLFKYHKGNYSMGNFYGHRSVDWGAGHGEDDYYFFNCSTEYEGFKENDPEYKLSKIMVNFMANFLATGKPTYINEEGEESQVWEPVKDLADIRMLQLDEEIKMVSMPNIERLKFWQNLNLSDAVSWITIK